MGRRADLFRRSAAGAALSASLVAMPHVASARCGPSTADSDAGAALAGASHVLDVETLCARLSAIATAEANLHGIVVERGGRLLLEAYFDGSDHPGASLFARDRSFTADDLHDIRSVTKSVTALLFGIAVDRGAIAGVDLPVLDFFPEYADLRESPKSRITLAHLLGMSSGLEWDESGSYVRLGNSETRMRLAGDPLRYVLERDRVAEPGMLFNYNGGGTALLGEVISRAVKSPLEAFAEEALFAPLGIGPVEWRRDGQGRVTPFGGLRLRPRDMAKIGRLVLGRGEWHSRRIVSAAWIDEMVKDRLPAGDLRYGWQWWRGELRAGTWHADYIAAFGNGGQRIYLMPSFDLVVVVTAGQYNRDTSWRAPLRVLVEAVRALR